MIGFTSGCLRDNITKTAECEYTAKKKFKQLIAELPSHLEADHPFYTSKYGKKWMENNDLKELARKHLYNHPDWKIYDEED